MTETWGEIKCGDVVVKSVGKSPADINTITAAINAAYEEKYGNRPNNKVWIDGLKHPDRVARTMEFVPF